MANELRHKDADPPGKLTEAVYEGVGTHIFNSQATGDILYASSSTQLSRLAKGSERQALILSGGVPAWADRSRKMFATFQIAGGESSAHVHCIPAGVLPQDLHVDKVAVCLENAAGNGKTVTVTVSDGTTTMTVAIEGDADTTGSTTTNNFDLDVSAKALTLAISSDGGTAAGCCSVTVIYHEVTIA
ncbi:unnamed protein product [marine sediment metagenome]|uniref:Uncharacterized protein n=1 Tax=marine sediment metagenome TaxID=412755 RepID=X1D8S7_9ZZZZ